MRDRRKVQSFPMSLTELIANVEAHEKTLTVFGGDAESLAQLRERFATRNVAIERGAVAEGPEGFAVLHDDGDFVTAVNLSALVGPEANGTGLADAPHQELLERLDETMFTAYDREQMLAASREIEDRAWRIGRGELHAGFQTPATMASQRESYERLAAAEALAVHAYAAAIDDDRPDLPGVSQHFADVEELRRTWFVVYDGDGVDANKCALLGEERDDGEFFGFWTYDPRTVDWIVSHLREQYGMAERGDPV